MVGTIIGAGAKSVLTSLWPTPDEATFMLMKVFYKSIKVLDKAKALQKAQIKVRRKYSMHPFLWGPFILVGAVN
jgi:CHAT domain-containing protein